jgi:hypothetical protein
MHQPVAVKASALANKSAVVNHASTIIRATPVIILRARRPCRNQTKVIKAVGFLGVARHNRRKPQYLSI